MSSLEELYFEWLVEQVGSSPARSRKTYSRLLKQMYLKEFVWVIANDDNRLADGRDLLQEYLELYPFPLSEQLRVDVGCSMLELLIVLARRLEFEGEGTIQDWFWELIDNCGLASYHDTRTGRFESDVDYILERLIWRTYKRDGQGGLFPLQDAQQDQREVELWYQLNAYLLERIH